MSECRNRRLTDKEMQEVVERLRTREGDEMSSLFLRDGRRYFRDCDGVVTDITDAPTCPECGYTWADAAVQLDHYRCKGRIPTTMARVD